MINYKDIRPGFYFAKRKDESPDDESIAFVTGEIGFLKVELWEPIITRNGSKTDEVDMARHKLIFTKCIKELDEK
jgi:hypothetical protein